MDPCDASRSAKWSDLYAEIFGPTGKPGSCVYTPACHGAPGAPGTFTGIECFDRAGCRASFLARGLTSADLASRPAEARLFRSTLRTPLAQGRMPLEPANFVFPQGCVDRITAWVRNGSPDD